MVEKKLTIIIAYYNTYELTCKLLDVLEPQITKEVEVYLVDDGCKETRLDKYKGINIIHLDENVGATTATNKALDKAVGKYIAFVDSDDMVSNDYVSSLLEAIDTFDKDVIFFDWQDMHSKKIYHRPGNIAFWKAIYRRTITPRLRDGWRYSYDVPFQEDLAKTNHTSCYLDKVLYIYNSNRPGSLTLEKAEIIKRKGN